MRYQVLGPLEAAGDGHDVALGGPKQRLVLALLLVHLGRVVSDERLVDELWPEDAPAGARHAIQTYVSELRRVLDDEIERAARGYRLHVRPEVVDAHRFETLVAAGRERLRDAPASAAALLREALALWHGEPFGGTADSPLLLAERHRLNDLRLAVVEDRVAAEVEAGRHAAVAAELEALTREHPDRERLHALRMVALYRSERQADALRAYQHARRWLADEMGLDPSPALQDLERRILNHDPTLRPVREAAGAPVTAVTTTEDPAMLRGFELRERIGTSDRGTTYRAYQPSVGREVAIKVYGRASRHDPDLVRGFEAAARRVAELDHPNVLPLLDWWRLADEACIVTPWMRRGDLARAIRDRPWSLVATLRLADQVGGALAAAHRAGMLHGALTARNILLDADGNALVADFVLDAPGEARSIRADVLALGVVLIATLSGRAPDDRESPILSLGHRRADLPPDLLAVLAQASSPVASDRHERVEDLLRDLRRAAGADVVAPAPEPSSPTRIRNPYKGLQAFQEVDAPDFFGRGAAIERMVEAIHSHRLVVVAGASGSGKSSLVRAGLLPALRSKPPPDGGELCVAEMFPGGFPFEELERALLRVAVDRPEDLHDRLVGDADGLLAAVDRVLPRGGQLLLVVDQLEEIWSLTEDPETRLRFVASLVRAARAPESRVRILATLRADFLDRTLESHEFGELTRTGLVLVTAPSRGDLVEAVATPAQQVGLQFERGLVDRIVRDVDDQPGALPLLQHALSELVARRDGHRLTQAGYEAIGGVTGALARRAESVYREVMPRGRETARQVFLRLVAVDELRDDSRRRVRRTELSSLGSDATLVDEVLRRFGAHRLLTFDRDPVTRGPTVEVAHEALFSEWERLRGWIDERRNELLSHRRLRGAAQDWIRVGRSPDYLLTGARLEEAAAWAASTDLVLSEDEHELLAASHERQTTDQRARSRRRRLGLGVATGVAVLAMGLATLAMVQLGRAEVGESEARARALAAASRSAGAVDHDLALILALDAVASTDAPLREAVEALHAATIGHRTLSSVQGGLFSGFSGPDVAVSLGRPLPGPMLWEAATGEILGYLEKPDAEWGDAAVSASGRLAVSTFEGEQTWIWDLRRRRVMARVGQGDGPEGRPAVSLDDRVLGVFVRDGPPTIRLYDIATGKVVSEFEVAGGQRMAFGAAGAWIAVTDQAEPVARLYEPMTGELIATLGQAEDGGNLWELAVDPSGGLLALFYDTPSRIEIYDVAAEQLLRTIPVAARPGRLCFLADGGAIVAQAADELLHVFDVKSGVEVLTLPGSGQVEGLGCAQDEPRIVLGVDGWLSRVFDLRASAATQRLAIPTAEGGFGVWAPDGSILIADAADGLRRLDASGRVLATARQSVAIDQGAWLPVSSDGTLAAVATTSDAARYGPIALLDARTLRAVRTFEGSDHAPVAFSPDGRLLLASGPSGAALFDVETGQLRGEPLRLPSGQPYFTVSGVFLPDGSHVVVKRPAAVEAWLFDVRSGSFVGTVCASREAIRVGVAPSGERLAMSHHPGGIEAWRLDGLPEAIGGSGERCAGDRPNASDGLRILQFAAPGEGGLAFSPDGRWIASTSGFDGALAVSDARTGDRLYEIEHAGEVSILGFSPDGRWLAITLNDTRGSDDALRIYAVETDDLVAQARAKVTRPLTPTECSAFPEALSCDEQPPSSTATHGPLRQDGPGRDATPKATDRP